MKSINLILFVLFASNLQAQINITHNVMRVGDEIVKQQMERTNPGKAGKDVSWDFSKLKTVNEEYTLKYIEPPKEKGLYIMGYDSIKSKDVIDGELIVGIEHLTMYYYRLKDNILYHLGHENPVVKYQYIQPLQLLSYPMDFGKEMRSEYTSWGKNSGKDTIKASGITTTVVDAYGSIIVPSGETHELAMRIKTIQIIAEIVDGEEQIRQLDKYNWYIKGYRYPIFEIIENSEDGEQFFATTFFYPPQEHYYLDTDPENQAIIDSLWNVDNFSIMDDDLTTKDNDIVLFPNPVESNLTIDYKVDSRSPTDVYIFSSNGMQMWKSKTKNLEEGIHTENVDCSRFPKGLYVVKVITNYGTNVKTLIKN